MAGEDSEPKSHKPIHWMDLITAAILMVPLSGSFMYVAAKWLLYDEPDSEYECLDGAAVRRCFKGETSNMIVTILLGTILLGFVIYGAYRLAWHRQWKRGRQGSRSG